MKRSRESRVKRVVGRSLRVATRLVIAAFALYGAWQLGARIGHRQAREVESPPKRVLAPASPRLETGGDALPEELLPSQPPEAEGEAAGQAEPPTAEEVPPVAGAPSADDTLTPEEPVEADDPVVEQLRRRRLLLPVEGIERAELLDTFEDPRGSRRHLAIDIPAPRNRPVVAVEDGEVVRLSNSPRGGIAIYQYDPSRSFVYFYAHLEAYAPGLVEGQRVAAGDLLGYVGTSGNAPPDVPHLHFAITRANGRRWWGGEPINPYPVLRWPL